MTAPTAATIVRLGPGTLEIGPTGATIDVSCNVQNAKIGNTKNTGTTVRYLCGSSVPGATTYDFVLTGQIDTDVASGAASLFDYCWNHSGETAEFSFTPNTDAGVTAAGELIVDPLEFGADEYGAPLTSAFSFSCVGRPNITYGAGAAATGVTAGSPGAFQPSGATPPATLSALKADPVVGDTGSNKPSATPWTTGQYVDLGDASDAHWSGTAWTAGPA
jgi:hypothetical protein